MYFRNVYIYTHHASVSVNFLMCKCSPFVIPFLYFVLIFFHHQDGQKMNDIDVYKYKVV